MLVVLNPTFSSSGHWTDDAVLLCTFTLEDQKVLLRMMLFNCKDKNKKSETIRLFWVNTSFPERLCVV